MTANRKPTVSIIVPVYNVERYLRRCVDSILAQTYPVLEVILVDDGSPDGCPEICDEYARLDSRVRVLHKKNGGVSSARNAGLDCVTGEYLTFCDSDDSYMPDWIESLVTAMERSGADVVVGNNIRVFEDGTQSQVSNHETGVVETATPESKAAYCMFQVLRDAHAWEIWSRLFRSGIVLRNGIRFCETCGNFAEDMGFTLEYALFANRVVSIPEAGYLYCIRGGSMMRSSAGTAKLDSVNEVSLHFARMCKKAFPPEYAERVWPVFHFLILFDQYAVLLYSGRIRELEKRLEEIQRFPEWKAGVKKLFSCRRELEAYFGKYDGRRILLLSRYCLHRSWLRFRVESRLFYALNKPGK